MAESSADPTIPPNTTEGDQNSGKDADGHGISFSLDEAQDERPSRSTQTSTPPYQSPLRHHKRTPSRTQRVKETLDAHSSYGSSEDDGAAIHRINQYSIKQEIGRGSFGSVHLAVDQYGNEYAVKEFSKSRLRKRAQSNLLKRPHPRRPDRMGSGWNVTSNLIHRQSSSDQNGDNNALSLIKEEIAIMKKLNHNNLVSLIEVLDDPDEDSLYMVLEICKKGVAMKVGLGEKAEPYDDETCRCWFRDMILGIEYLHAQGIIHRDIKPDNCLITNDDVLKIVDFGVSEMFEKSSEMATAKSAGSPAFMPPELCVAKHGQVSGRSADIWSMGVTLYCLRYGSIPFEKESMIELYESIRIDEVSLDEEKNPDFRDLMRRLLDKNPETRITMDELRNHPWITIGGTDTLLSAEENCADLVEPPTELEMHHAITGNMGNLLVVMKAARRFKSAMSRKRGGLRAMFDRDSQLVAPPDDIDPLESISALRKQLSGNGSATTSEQLRTLPRKIYALATNPNAPEEQGIRKSDSGRGPSRAETHRRTSDQQPSMPNSPSASSMTEDRSRVNTEDHAKGHAHDPLEDRLFLNIGSDPTTSEGNEEDLPVVSESPSAVETAIFEDAYREEMDRIMEERGQSASMFMNRRVDHREDIRLHENICDAGKYMMRNAADKLNELQTKGHAAGADFSDAGRLAARSAIDKLNDTDWRAEIDSRKQNAKVAANEGYVNSKSFAQNATDRLAPKAEKAAGKFADLVAKAQTKNSDEGSSSPSLSFLSKSKK